VRFVWRNFVFQTVKTENNMSEDENVLEDFSGMTQVNGVTITPPDNHTETADEPQKEDHNFLQKSSQKEDQQYPHQQQAQPRPQDLQQGVVFQTPERPKFFDVLKSLGTTTLIIMALVILFLLFIGYRYMFA
jgi:hypothetical protein